jgi:tetratricopeptide (TPR) repeat protein
LKAVPVRNALSVIAVVLFVFTFFSWNVKPMRASMHLIDALRHLQSSRLEESLNTFESILRERMTGTTETREQLVTVAPTFLAEGVSDDIRERYVMFARREMNKHVSEYPSDARAHIFHANFLRKLGLYALAFESYEKALSLSPNKQSFILEVGATHLAVGNYEEAYQSFKFASELDLRFEEVKIIYAIGALYTGRMEEAGEILSGVPDEIVIFDNRLANTYAELDRYSELIALLSARLETERGKADLQNYTSLAIAYSEIGNKTRAVEVVREALIRHPNQQADLETFLGQIQSR